MVSKVNTCLKPADLTISWLCGPTDAWILLQSGFRHRRVQVACSGWNQGPVILTFLVVACK
jgi:hypothetical protein